MLNELYDIADILEAISDVLELHPSPYGHSWLDHECLDLQIRVDNLIQKLKP